MTVSEALSQNQKGEVVVSQGETIRSVCYRVYKTQSDAHLRAFCLLNLRSDIQNLKPGATLITLPESILLQINEL